MRSCDGVVNLRTGRAMNGTKREYVGLNPMPPDFAAMYPPIAFVVEEYCIGCDRCIPLCFFDALEMIDKPEHKYRRVALVEPKHCTGCGLCFEACPTDAFVWVPDRSDERHASKGEGDLEDTNI